MRAITLARRPPEHDLASNCQEYQCGVINIDGCRIGDTGGSRTPSGLKRFHDFAKRHGGSKGDYSPTHSEPPPESGRWPSNVILDEEYSDVKSGIFLVVKS